MNLWTVCTIGYGEYGVFQGSACIVRMRNVENAKRICDEHNAWVILEHYGWSVKQWASSKWGVVDNFGRCPWALISYEDNAHATPAQAVLAAHAWVMERGQAK